MSSPFGWADFLVTTGACAALVVLLMGTVWVITRRGGRIAVVDVVWGLGFVLVAALSAALSLTWAGRGSGPFVADHRVRSVLLLVLVLVWGGRLAWHIRRRAVGAGEDPRYEKIMATGPGGLVRKVLLPQGVAMWFVSLPVQVSAISWGAIGWLTWLGVAVWLLGFCFETVGDAQLAAYKQDPDRGPVMDRGLWHFTRHPNYFGDACVWWGIWLIAADAWPGLLTVLSPVIMTFFLIFATGARLLEHEMMKRKGYPEYAERTSMFLPLPPKRG